MSISNSSCKSLAIPRRDFLKRGVVAAGAALPWSLGLKRTKAADDSRGAGRAIDAHVHVWTPDTSRYPLASGYTAAAMQPASFTPQQLFTHARPMCVGRIVLIQMSYYGFDNRYMLDVMREHPGVFSGVAVIDHHAADALGTMRALKRQGVRGFRIHPTSEPAERWLFDPDMMALWRHGADERLAMCALINPNALEPLDRMCRKFPDTTLVVDHFARIGIDGIIRDTDVDNLCRLARHKNTYVKTSAFYALGKKKAPYTDMGPMIRRLLTAFGPQRLMWASDCPFQVQAGHTYADSIELLRSRLDFLTTDDRAWMLEKTAEKVFFL